jgi:hypothetical protein
MSTHPSRHPWFLRHLPLSQQKAPKSPAKRLGTAAPIVKKS